MNRDRVKLLIEALRSGKYKKAKYSLRVGNCYCIEGLMCEISGVGEWVEIGRRKDIIRNGQVVDNPEYGYKLPDGIVATIWLSYNDAVNQWFGLLTPLLVKAKNTTRNVVEYFDVAYFNDHEDWSFKKLANAIEKQYSLKD